MPPARRRDRNSKRADAILSYIIPAFFMFLAVYQQVTSGHIDKYVVGAIFIFGIGALGWRIDLIFEKYLEARLSSRELLPKDEEKEKQ